MMIEQGSPGTRDDQAGSDARAAGTRTPSAALATTQIVRQLISRERDNLFSDAVLACTSAMLGDLARQLLHAAADVAEREDREAFVGLHEDALREILSEDSALLAHCHALAIESMLADRLHSRAAIDPALPPLIKVQLASEDQELASAAMHVLAAQSRFLHSARRMELPLAELPPELFHASVKALGAMPFVEEAEGKGAKAALADGYDDAARRFSQIARFHLLLQDKDDAPLALEDAGLAIFAYALADASNRPRGDIVLALAETDPASLSDLLRIADWPIAQAQQALVTLYPESSSAAADSASERG